MTTGPQPGDRRQTDATVALLQQDVEMLRETMGELRVTVQGLQAIIEQQRGAFRLGNWLVGVLTTIILALGSWGVSTISQTKLQLQETQSLVGEVSRLLRDHGQLDFHNGGYPILSNMERELTALRITLERMDREERRRSDGR